MIFIRNANSRRHSQPSNRHHFFSSRRLHSFFHFRFQFQFQFQFWFLISNFVIFEEWLVDRKRVPSDWRKRFAAIKAQISKEFSSLPKDSDPLFQTLDPEGLKIYGFFFYYCVVHLILLLKKCISISVCVWLVTKIHYELINFRA